MVGGGLFLLGLGLAGVAFALVDDRRHGHVVVDLVWAGSLLATTLAAMVADSVALRLRLRLPDRRGWAGLGLVAGLTVLALSLRLPHLTGTPADVHGDEASIGLEAQAFLSGQNPNLFTVGFAAMPRLSYAIPAVSMRIFGNDLFGLRMASVRDWLGPAFRVRRPSI